MPKHTKAKKAQRRLRVAKNTAAAKKIRKRTRHA